MSNFSQPSSSSSVSKVSINWVPWSGLKLFVVFEVELDAASKLLKLLELVVAPKLMRGLKDDVVTVDLKLFKN